MSKLLAPNGKPSNLTPEQYALVRTPEFKAWFGDWENNPESASKIVDENGEPLMVFHGTNSDFYEFDERSIGSANDEGFYGRGFYFTFQKEFKDIRYAIGEASYYGKKLLTCYIKALNPFDFQALSNYKARRIFYYGAKSLVFLNNIATLFPKIADKIFIEKKIWNSRTQEYDFAKVPISVLPSLVKKYAKLLKYIETKGEYEKNETIGYVKSKIVKYDYTDKGGSKGQYEDFEDLGRVQSEMSNEAKEIIFVELALDKYEGLSFRFSPEGYMTRNSIITDAIKEKHDCILQSEYGDELVVFSGNQIKLADGTNTTFDENNFDIRYEEGGSISKYKSYEIEIQERPLTLRVEATIKQNGNQIGSISLDDFPNDPYVAYSHIDKEHSGKGLGSYVYELLDNYSFNKTGKHITHGDINSSISAIRLWRKRLKDKNYLPDNFYGYWGEDADAVLKDLNNPDIRYSKGGNTQQGLEVKLVQDKDLSDELLNIAYVELGYVGQPRLALLEKGKIIGGIFLEKPSSYIENGEYVVQPMWEYKFDIVIVKSKRNKGYSKILLDAMIEDFVSNFPDADQIRAEVTNKKLEKSLQKNYGFSCNSRNDEKITYCYLSKEDGEKYKNTADIKFENGGTTKKNMKKVDKGGITYGRSHAEGGIPVKNKSTGEMLEVEGGEGIINKKAMASPQMVKIDGKEMTICEAASYLNQKDGNGRQFNCDDVEHQQFLTDHYGVGGELKKGIATEKEHSKTLNKLYNQDINPNQAIREVAKEHIKENPNYYSDLNKMEGEMAKGGMTAQESLLKELNRLQRDLNSSRLSTYIEGDTSDEEMQRRRERESKMKRFNEVLETLRELDAKKYATGGTVMNNQDAENAIFDAAVFEHGGTVNAYDAGLHKKMYMLGIEVMQPDPIALARVMSKENDNFCEHYPKLCAGAEYQREELPQIYDKNYEEFVAYLENLGATVNFEGDTAVDSLKPVQNEISLERMARIMARVKEGYYKDLNLLKLPLFVSKDGYILDGHHRWATLFFLSPTNTLDIYRVNLTYKELVDNALNFDDAGTEKFMIGGMITKQQQLDTALKIKAKSAKGVVDIYYSFVSDFRYTELVRVEGSSQALFTTLFNRKGGMFLFRFSGFDQFIKETLNNFWKELLIQESMGSYQVWYESFEASEKRKKAYDFFINKTQSSTGIIKIFDTAQPEYDSRFSALYALTIARCIEEIIVELSSKDWTITPFTDFLSSDRMLEVKALFNINVVKIVNAVKESLNPKSGVIDFGQFDTNFVNNIPTYISTTKPKATSNWNWRFKTEQEFIDQYGTTNWKPRVTKGITAWLDDMDYLLGKPIIESKQAKEYIKASQTGYYFNVLDKFYIANTANPSENYWEISKDMLINKPLPTAAAPAPPNTPSTVNMQGTYSYFDVAYETASGEIKFDFTDPPKDCRVEIACDIDRQITVLDDMDFNRQTSKREELFTDFLVEELNDTNDLLSRRNQGYNLKFEGKDSYGYTIVKVDSMRSSTGIIETIESNLPISNYLIYKISSAVANFATTLLQMLDSTNWRGSGIPQFKQDSRYVDAKNELEKALYVVYIMALNVNDEQQKGKQLKDIDFSFWLDNFKKSSKTTRSANVNTGWTWRFKTEQEFINQYGDNWDTQFEDIDWLREEDYNMDFLFGQPISKNDTSQRIIESIVNDKMDYETVNVEEYFGIKNPDPNGNKEFSITEDFITQNPVQNAVATTSSNVSTRNNDYLYFTVVYAKGGGEVRYFYKELPNNCRVEFVCNIDSQNEVIQRIKAKTPAKFANYPLEEQFLSYIVAALNLLMQDPQKSNGTGSWKLAWEGEYKLWNTVKVDLGNTSRRISDLIKSELPIADYLNYKISAAAANYSGTLLQMLDNSSWNNFDEIKQDSRYRDAEIEFKKEFQAVWDIADYTNSQLTGLTKALADVDYSQWLDNFKNYRDSNTTPVSSTFAPVDWNWRFKTREEFEKEYGRAWKVKLNWVSSNKMDYLFGQPLQEKPQGKIVINNFINNIFTASTVNTEGAFGLVSPTGDNMWEMKFEMFTQKPLPVAVTPATQKQVKSIKEIPYLELLESGVLTKTQTIVGARFMTLQEMKDNNKKYDTSFYGFYSTFVDIDFVGYSESEIKKYYDDEVKNKPLGKTTQALLGEQINPLLLKTITEVFKFQKSLDPKTARELFKTSYTVPNSQQVKTSRLRLGYSGFDNFDFWKPLFPILNEQDYKQKSYLSAIFEPKYEFPSWYKNYVEAFVSAYAKSEDNDSDAGIKYVLDNKNLNANTKYPYNFFTGLEKTAFKEVELGYTIIPFYYLVLKIEDTSVTPTATKKPIKKKQSIYYKELLEKGMPLPNSKIVGARFLTKDEISSYNKKYGTSLAGLELSLDCDVVLDKKALQDYEFRIKEDIKDEDDALKWSGNAVLGKNLNPNLLPMAIALYKFDKDYYTKNKKSLYLTTGLEEIKEKDFLKDSRLCFGSAAPFEENDFWKPLFPTSNKTEFKDFTAYQDIIDYKFPDWYKALLKEVVRTQKEYYVGVGRTNSVNDAERQASITDNVYNVPSVFTGMSNIATRETQQGYFFLPMSYLMFEIETEENTSTNSTAVKKLKEEYAALQYYLNVEVPIDAFAQRKLISSVMQTVSDNLEKEIEALYYSPSFEPLFEFWAEKQTQGQRMIDLQPCMLPTPNGEKSELDLVQYEIVRSEEFKKWFGDWEEAAKTGNYNGVSKAINPLTKEPQVVFHGKANMVLEFSKMAFALFPVKYFGTNLSYAEWFKINQSKSDRLTKLVYEFFVDIKNPIDLSPIGLTELTAEDLKEVIKAQYNYEIQSPIAGQGTGDKMKLWRLIRGSEQMLEELKANTYFDGLIMYEDNLQDLTASGYDTGLLGFSPNSYELVQQVAGTPIGNFTLDFVTFTNFQIKAADGRNTTFFNNVEDFRFAKGGITKKRKK